MRAIAEAQGGLVAKQDLEFALAPLRADVRLLKWVMGFVLAGMVSILLKLFQPEIFSTLRVTVVMTLAAEFAGLAQGAQLDRQGSKR